MVRVQLYTYSTCTVNVVYNYSIFADRYFRTKVLSYESTFVLSYNVVRRYCVRVLYGSTFVLSYHTKVLSYFRTFVRKYNYMYNYVYTYVV